MKLDYGTMISSYPIRLTVGTVKKPTIDDVERIGFDEFGLIEGFLSLKPKNYYAKNKNENIEYWDSLSEAEKESLSIYPIFGISGLTTNQNPSDSPQPHI